MSIFLLKYTILTNLVVSKSPWTITNHFYRYFLLTLLHTLDIRLFTPEVMPITQMLNTLIESQHINPNPDSLFYFFTDYDRKYISDAI